jgi:hypothetical protein
VRLCLMRIGSTGENRRRPRLLLLLLRAQR